MKKEKNNILKIGEDFYKKNSIKSDYFTNYYSLNECFNKWSIYKQNIYNYYYDLLKNNCDKVIYYGIRSYNSMIIILHSEIIKNNKRYYLLITPKYNWYKEI